MEAKSAIEADAGLGVTVSATPPIVKLKAVKSPVLGVVPKLTPLSTVSVLDAPVETPGFELLSVKFN